MFDKIVKGIRQKAKKVSDASHFSVKLTLFRLIPFSVRFSMKFRKKAFYKMRHTIILNYLRKNYSHVIEKYKNIKIESEPVKDDCPIFVCWFQGEEAMPPVVKACYASLKKFAQKHPVVLITMENYSQYVKIPEHILHKLDEGKMKLAHFSDIIRSSLLSKHNAIWLDSTIYLTSPLNWPATAFHTIKGYTLCTDDFVVSMWTPFCKDLLKYCYWAIYCMGGGSFLFSFLSEALLEYWRKENLAIDYFLMDYFVALAYEEFPEVKRLFDAVPFNNANTEYLQKHFEDDFDKDQLQAILKSTSIFKISYKSMWLKNTPRENSIYRKIVDGKFLDEFEK